MARPKSEYKSIVEMQETAYLSLGSNLGNREQNLRDAIRRLESIGRVRAISSIYETEPVDIIDQPTFLNCAVALETQASPDQFIEQLLEIEKLMGRKRVQKKGPRIIDLDILFLGDQVVNTPALTIPHPAMHQRRFVLAPLAEIAPGAKHPVLKKTVAELLENMPPGQSVRRIVPTAGSKHRR